MNKPRAKGTRGENLARDWWKPMFPNVDRAPLRGTLDTGDLTNLPLTVSVKNCETWPVHKWRKDLAKMEANSGLHGVVQARRNRDEWVFIVPQATMRYLLESIYGGAND